ncbi:hypothetical protein, partial [Bartonella sp. AP83NXGY]|uniref:hypothetical protein n=1 Tax=Bartonella sp. AP83NXGY TaxID=3243504 RepID=UPI0035D0BF8B
VHQPNTRLHQQNSIKKPVQDLKTTPKPSTKEKPQHKQPTFSCNTIYFFAPQLLFSKEQKNDDTQSNL